jgi:mRNA-degrading endonuclease toxin of MazEF toxin-antitoxin module
MAGRYAWGRIVLAYVDDGQGRTKERPVLIISQDEDNDRGDPLQVVAISTRIEDPCPEYHIPSPWDARGHQVTGLNRPAVAKCNWVREIDQARVIRPLFLGRQNSLERRFEPPGRLKMGKMGGRGDHFRGLPTPI